MKKDELEETNETLQYIEEIFNDEKMIHCIHQFNVGNPTQKIVYSAAAIKYLLHYFNDINELLNFLHSILTLDILSKYQ